LSPASDPLAIKPADLPAPPQAAIEIMRACSRQDVSLQELSRLAGSDPMLTAELLRLVNSSFYGLSRSVQSLSHAVTVLGQRALRNLCLCISVRDALKGGALAGLDTTGFWEDSLRRAVSARLLAEPARLLPDDCFTAGLLQDFGLLVMLYLAPDKAPLWPSLRAQDPASRLAAEHASFQTGHDQVGLNLAQSWQLPETLAQAIGSHHQSTDSLAEDEAKHLARVLHCADWMACVYSVTDKGSALERCREVAANLLALDRQATEECLSNIPQQVEDAASALGLHISQQEDFDQILRGANLQLAAENLSYQELTWELRKTLDERDRLAEELSAELELARAIQRSLLPTATEPDFPVAGTNVPAGELSGDFYDHFRLPDGRIYFNLADVSGKGINAALVMAKTSSLFRCLGKQVDQPGALLEQINAELCETSVRGTFVTMIAGLYEPNTDSLHLVNAGHPPALLVSRHGKVRALGAQAPPLGIIPGTAFPEVQLELNDESLYLFSDGLSEGRTTDGSTPGLRGVVQMVAAADKLPRAERLESLLSRYHDAATTLKDDLTILMLDT
jgi:HD-like signal output (HDOD) protein/serine phosphatase RsbU (regulator of sigma subunit)